MAILTSRKRRFCALFPLLSALVPLASADRVVLKNGDVITGAIVKKDGPKLILKSEFLGEVGMPWSAVQSIRSDENLTVVLPGGESVSGKIGTTGDSLQITGPGLTKSAPLAGIAALRNPAEQRAWERLQRPSLFQLWTGAFDTGLALTRGNARSDSLTTAFNATRVTRKDKIVTYFNQIYGRARVNGLTSTTASAVRGGWSYNRDLTPRFFVSTRNDYEHDRFQSLDLRFVAGGGLAVNAFKKERTNLSFIGGGDYARENFTTNLHRNSGEANFGDDFLHKLSGTSSVTQSFRFFANLTNTGEYRVSFDVSAVTAVKKWLGWHVTASERYLSNPVFGRQRNDLLISTGFRLSFAK